MIAGNISIDAIIVDQQSRWAKGERIRVEEYLAEHIRLANDNEATLDLIYNEILLRDEFGPPPSFENLRDRFPQLSDEIDRLLCVHQSIEGNASDRSQNRQSRTRTGYSTESTNPIVHDNTALRACELPTIPGYVLLDEIGRGGDGHRLSRSAFEHESHRCSEDHPSWERFRRAATSKDFSSKRKRPPDWITPTSFQSSMSDKRMSCISIRCVSLTGTHLLSYWNLGHCQSETLSR